MFNVDFCQILFALTFEKCFITVRKMFTNTVLSLLGWGRKLLFFVCVPINTQRIVCSTYCREFEAVVCALHHCACEIACNAPPSSATTTDFCVGLVHSDEQASLWPSEARSELRAFFRKNFILRGCAGVAATGGTRRAHHPTHVKEILLLPDSNNVTQTPVFRVVSCHDLQCQDWVTHRSFRNQRTSESSFALALFIRVRSVEPVCFPASHRALLHMKPHGSLTTTVPRLNTTCGQQRL